MKHPTKRALVVALAALFPLHTYAIPPGMRYDPTSLPTPATGFSTEKVSANTGNPPAAGADFRTNCKRSHMGPNDPILNAPGSVDASHLHTFYGDVSIDGDTDIDEHPQTRAANTTCKGGTVNRTAYWHPSAIDTRTGDAQAPLDLLVYYKHRHVNIMPAQLRFIPGTATRTSAGAEGITVVNFRCQGGGTGNYHSSISEVVCPAGAQVWAHVNADRCLSMDGAAPFGTMSGTADTANWRWVTIGPAADSAIITYLSTAQNTNVPDIPVSGGGGAAAPTVVTFDGELFERAEITVPALTAGQSITIAGRTYTSTGATTAGEVAKAMSGGNPDTDSADHKSHLAPFDDTIPGATGTKGICPVTHPYQIPSIAIVAAWLVPDDEWTENVRFASDDFSGPAGYSFHADWRNGWKDDEVRKWIYGCNRAPLNCHAHLRGAKDENNVDTNAPQGWKYQF